MKTETAIRYLQKRLAAMNEGKRFSWTLNDRAAVSHLLIEFEKDESLLSDVIKQVIEQFEASRSAE